MGGGITMACVNAGMPVTIKDATQEALDRGLATIRRNYESSVKRGRLTADAGRAALAAITPPLDDDGVDEADLIIEAVFESMALKKQVFRDVDGAAKPDAVLATNTSTLDIDAIAAVTSRPASVVGLHFFSPANVMRLVEVVRGAKTSPEALATRRRLREAARQSPGRRRQLPRVRRQPDDVSRTCTRRSSSSRKGRPPSRWTTR